jgi:MEDS: MEthanogen/methylotroph, DcmR Sensory domain
MYFGSADRMSYMDTNWRELVKHPAHNDHIVQTYQDEAFLAEAVAEYIGYGLKQGDAGVIIARPEHIRGFKRELVALGCYPEQAIRNGQLKLFDAGETLAKLIVNGKPQWRPFRELVGELVAELRLQYPNVRAYGEMVDILWQSGRYDAAIQLEEYWNDLAMLQSFSLFCAYQMDPLDDTVYGGPLERVCKVHTHLIPTRDYSRLNAAVNDTSKEVLDQPLAQMLLSLSAHHRPATQMPLGQATLLWLKRNMPRTAGKVLDGVRARCTSA